MGAIKAHAYGVDAFAEHAVVMSVTFAGPAAVSVLNAQLLTGAQQRAEQLQRALGSQQIVDEAVRRARSRYDRS